jgi:hypothetical protein
MAHAQNPDLVFRRNGRVHFNHRRRQFSRLLVVEECASAFVVGSNAGYTMFRGSVKGTGYPLHSPISPSLPLPCVTVCHHISAGIYVTRCLPCAVLYACTYSLQCLQAIYMCRYCKISNRAECGVCSVRSALSTLLNAAVAVLQQLTVS